MPNRFLKSKCLHRATAWMALVGMLLSTGCATNRGGRFGDNDLAHYRGYATSIELADEPDSINPQSQVALSPDSLGADKPVEYWDITLEEAMQHTLEHTTILRDLGGTVLRNPAQARGAQQVAITETDPRYGVQAALSDFDTNFATRVFHEKNDRAVNNAFIGGGTTIVQQDLTTFQTAFTKRGIAGTQLAIRHNTDYDANNAPANTFFSAWNTNIELEARQPLLRGAGAMYNRIAGATGVPGFANGVLIARINTDVSLADFEGGVRDLTSNVENAYWDLYLAYRDLDAKVRARDAALDSWRRIHALFAAGRVGGEAEKEAEAREQYFRFQEEVQNALAGKLIDGTQTGNGSSGGTQRQIPGVRVAERRLRLLTGMPISDGRLLRPKDEPLMAKLVYDWEEVLPEALGRRVELRRQRFQIKRRELELLASKHYLLPQLDTVGRYRARGFGKDLIDLNSKGDPRFSNAYRDLLSGDFQEWQLGVEFNVPLGFRRGHAAVRNAELTLARERSLLAEQERNIVHDLSNAIAETERAFQAVQTSFNRRLAANEQLDAVSAAYEADQTPFFQVLDAQRRLVDAEQRFSLAQVEYALSTKNVHFEKGTLLDYNQIALSEGPWPGKAHCDAQRLVTKRDCMNYRFTAPPVSVGSMPQRTLPPIAPSEPLPPPTAATLPTPANEPELLPPVK